VTPSATVEPVVSAKGGHATSHSKTADAVAPFTIPIAHLRVSSAAVQAALARTTRLKCLTSIMGLFGWAVNFGSEQACVGGQSVVFEVFCRLLMLAALCGPVCIACRAGCSLSLLSFDASTRHGVEPFVENRNFRAVLIVSRAGAVAPLVPRLVGVRSL
jgi:hypothetical protein